IAEKICLKKRSTMGVKGLQWFVANACPNACTMVNLKEMAEKHHIDHPDSPPVIVVDAMGCIRQWYTSESWVCGGQWQEYLANLQHFIKTFMAAGIKLVFYFDGVVEQKKRNEWVKRRLKNNKEITRIFQFLKSNRQQPGRGMFFIPSGLATFTRFALKSLGQETICSLQEADYEVASFGLQNNCMGILGQDTDYLIYNTSPYFSISKLCLDRMVTVMYSREILCHTLGLNIMDLPLFACLLGNDILPEDILEGFWQKCVASCPPKSQNYDKKTNIILAVANYISKLPCSYDSLKDLKEMLPLASDKLLYRGVESYLLPGQQSPWLPPNDSQMHLVKQEIATCADQDIFQNMPRSSTQDIKVTIPSLMECRIGRDLESINESYPEGPKTLSKDFPDPKNLVYRNVFQDSVNHTCMCGSKFGKIAISTSSAAAINTAKAMSTIESLRYKSPSFIDSKIKILMSFHVYLQISLPTPCSRAVCCALIGCQCVSFSVFVCVPIGGKSRMIFWTEKKKAVLVTSSSIACFQARAPELLAIKTRPQLTEALLFLFWELLVAKENGGMIIGNFIKSLVFEAELDSDHLKLAKEQHIRAENYMVYNVLSKGEVECSNTLEDEFDTELPGQALIYRPVRQHIYSVLLESRKGPSTTSRCVDVKEWFVYFGNPMQQPDLVQPVQLDIPGGTPSLRTLWLTKGSEVKTLQYNTFLACFHLQDMVGEFQLLDAPVAAVCCLLIYLTLQVDSLSLEDLNAFVAHTLCLQGKSVAQLAGFQ
uniref:Constitutive coactivator of peroxisome proliferator-activated receptor gamma n=1 Tax=Pelodiscus sinensis TaxID=13735 RepID=K7FU60_PELSI